MALYERIKAEFNDINGRDYTIRIYKEAVSDPGSRTFTSGGEGFIHEYFGDSEELWDFIKYGKVTIPLVIADATDKSVSDEVIEGNEGEWFCKITYNSDANIYFQGIVLIDQSEYANVSYPYILNIIASDGLSLLQNKKITSLSGFTVPFNVWFTEILDQFSFDELGGFNLYTCFRDWNELMLSYNSSAETRDPLTYMFVETNELFYTDKRGGRDFFTYGDVITELCNFLHCNLFYSEGAYYLVSIYERLNSTLYMTQYDEDFTFDITNPNSYANGGTGWSQDTTFSHTINFSSNNIKPQGGLFRTKPASKLIRESNGAEGAFKKGTLSENSLAVWRPSDSGTSGSYNVPETVLARVADIKDGIDSVTVKGRVSFYVREEAPFTSNPTLDANNRTIKWKLRGFFAQKNTTAYSFTYGSENVFKESTGTWTTGSDAYIEQDLGNINGTTTNYNIKETTDIANTALTSATTTTVQVTDAIFRLISQPLVNGYRGWLRIQNNNSDWVYARYESAFWTGSVFSITIESTDFSVVNANVGNTVEIIQEKTTLYQSNFEFSVDSFPTNDNLFFNVALIGEDYTGNDRDWETIY